MNRSRRFALSALVVTLVVACGSADASDPVAAGSTGTLELGALPGQVVGRASGPLPSSGEGQEPATDDLPPYVLAATTPRPISDPRVMMIGDSVLLACTLGAPDSLDLYVGALGWELTVDAETGRFADQALRVARRRAHEMHQTLVLMLGNNYRLDADQFREEMEEIIALGPDLRRILVFTVPRWQAAQQEVNDVLFAMAATDDRIMLVEWERASGEFRGALRSDGLHPTQYGSDILGQLIGNALGLGPDAPAGTELPEIGRAIRPDGKAVDKGESANSSGASADSATSSGGSGGGATPNTTPRRTTTTSATPSSTPTSSEVTSTTVDASSTTSTPDEPPTGGTGDPPSESSVPTATTTAPTTAAPEPATITVGGGG